MTSADTLASDLAWMDGAQPVTVTLYRQSGTVHISIPFALKRHSDRPLRTFGGVAVDGNEVVWHVPAVHLGESSLQAGDLIATNGTPEGDSEQWSVLEVASTTLDGRLVARCRALGRG